MKYLEKPRNIAIIAVVIAVVLIVAYFAYPLIAPIPTSEETIKIGWVSELSGFWAQNALPMVPAAKLGVQYVNEHGGVVVQGVRYNFELVIRDDRTDVPTAVSYASELMEEVGCVVLTGTSSSDMGLALRSYAESKKIPYLTTMVSSPALNQPPTDWAYRIQPDGVQVGATHAMYMLDQNPDAKVAIMYADHSFFGALAFGCRYYFEEYASEDQIVYFQGFPISQADFTAACAYVKALNPDFILAAFDRQELVQSLLQAGFTVDQICNFFLIDLSPKRAIAYTAENILGAQGFPCTSHWIAEAENDPIYDWFWPLYKEEYGDIPNVGALYALDCIFLIKSAIERADSLEHDKVNEALQNTEYQSFSYPNMILKFDENGGLVLPKYPYARVVEVFNSTCSRSEIIGFYELPEIPYYELAVAYPVYPY
ncbi:MAG: ABC transporter substrate-binding protein [Promethearchaeota archaeon]